MHTFLHQSSIRAAHFETFEVTHSAKDEIAIPIHAAEERHQQARCIDVLGGVKFTKYLR